MNESTSGRQNRSAAAPCEPPQNGEFVAPLGTATRGRLVFASGAAGVTLRAGSDAADLYQAYFERPVPSVRAQSGTVTIRYRRYPLFDWLYYWFEPLAEIALNTSIPWQIELRGGVSKLSADLRGLQLSALDVRGGASEVEITLPPPTGHVMVRVTGGASNLTVHRPAGAAVRARVRRGVSRLAFDGEHFGAIGGETLRKTPDYDRAADRYDIDIAGGASKLTIETYQER